MAELNQNNVVFDYLNNLLVSDPIDTSSPESDSDFQRLKGIFDNISIDRNRSLSCLKEPESPNESYVAALALLKIVKVLPDGRLRQYSLSKGLGWLDEAQTEPCSHFEFVGSTYLTQTSVTGFKV